MSFQAFCKKFKPTQEELVSEFYDLFESSIEVKNKSIAVDKLKTIITATFKLVSSQSFASMSLRQLSDETGISMGGLYSYIKNKQQLSLYIHQFLNYFAEKIFAQTKTDLDNLIKTHIYLSEILHPWFFFVFMESKNLDKNMKKFAINSELLMEEWLITAIEKGQERGIYKAELSAEVMAAHIKPLLHDWYLKRWKYKQRKTSVDAFYSSTIMFINCGIMSHHSQTETEENG